MADTVIGVELCPACGRVTWLVRLHSGPAYFHEGLEEGRLCLGLAFVHQSEAEAVRLIREREPGLTVRAHP